MNGKRPLTQHEQARLLAHLKHSGNARNHLFVLMGLRTGYRARELLAIQVKHFVVAGTIGHEILLPRRSMKFGRGKLAHTVAGRRMPIHPELRAALEEFWKTRMRQPLDPESFLFEGKRPGHAISVVHAWRLFTRACRALGIVGRVALHSMRKSFAVEIHGITRDLVKTQAILGHQSPLTTVLYLETPLHDLDAIVFELGRSARSARRAS